MTSFENLNLDAVETLSDEERLVLMRLLLQETISESQAQEALDIHRRNRTPLLDVLGAQGHIKQRDYAVNLADVTGAGFLSDLIGTEHLSLDSDFVRKFSPADLIRHLFCPLQNIDNLVPVLAVDPTDELIEELVRAVVPDAEVVAMVGRERDVTHLVDEVFQEHLIFKSVNELRLTWPESSASVVFTRFQTAFFILLIVLIAVGLVWRFESSANLLILITSISYMVAILFKTIVSFVGLIQGPQRQKQAENVEPLSDAELPLYSILVPVYKETTVVPTLLKALAGMDYPREKLDVLLLMEEDDSETIEAAKAANPPTFFRFIYIPESLPRTKPKACNYGLNFCRGEYVAIFDAEDIPAPDQLKKAVLAFRQGSSDLVSVQAALDHFNVKESYLTRMFNLEYAYWFYYTLPGLAHLDLPLPLGGTSNHFRADKLRQLHAWDPFNVTEDADLGMRISTHGSRIDVLNTATYEEATQKAENWIRQRSRWLKGWMQTWLVYNRHPARQIRSMGVLSWFSFQLLIGGRCLIFLTNPLMWLLFVFWLFWGRSGSLGLLHQWTLSVALFSFILGNTLGVILNLLPVVGKRRLSLLPYAFTNIAYWWMHSTAAYVGLWQLFTKPFYWEKTEHGLSDVNASTLVTSDSLSEIT